MLRAFDVVGRIAVTGFCGLVEHLLKLVKAQQER
jgi:hypothetical protein